MSKAGVESEARRGRYDILALLGRGGMGEVYLAAHRGPSAFAKLVVLKILRTELVADDSMLAMFEDEARVSAQLIHPNIAQTLELCMDETKPYLVMEYLDGQPLSTVFRRLAKQGATISPRVLARIAIDILSALEYAHTSTDLSGAPLHLVHRDVSPQNVFVTYAGQAKLLDFGIAKVVVRSENTKTGVLKGKVAFMAPEQALGLPVDCRVDLFALGMVLLQGLTGKKPWNRTDDMQILLALAAGRIPCPAELLGADVPRALVDVCTRALAANRDDRYWSAREMRVELEAFLESYKDAGDSENVGELLDRLFAEERAEKKALIEGKLKELMDGRWSLPPGAASSRRLKLRTTLVDEGSTPPPTNVPSTSAPASAVPPSERPVLPEARRSGRIALVLASAVALAAGIWFVRPLGQSGSPSAQSASPATAAAENPPPPLEDSAQPAATAPVVVEQPIPRPAASSAAAPSAASQPSTSLATPHARAPKRVSPQSPAPAKHAPMPAPPSSGGAFDLGSQE